MTISDLLQKKNRNGMHRPSHEPPAGSFEHDLYLEEYFNHSLYVETRRAERSRKPFMLMLVDISSFGNRKVEKETVAKRITGHLFAVTRETDIKGWYRYDSVIGTIFTEMGDTAKNLAATQAELCDKLSKNLTLLLNADQLKRITVSWHVFPDDLIAPVPDSPHGTGGKSSSLIEKPGKKGGLLAKRMLDIAGSLCALLLCAPAFAVIAALIKLTSEGPVLFKQERIGLSGKKFTFLKFRSMYVNNDPTVHKEYIKKLMAAQVNAGANPGENGVYKITRDPRVTSIGRLLRRTSLDELPQFVNVLTGDMSLVGPRPPIPYEWQGYDIWHHRRVLEVKPGITGLWQVNGRSATTFDDMVRMDIRYIREWSLWLDIKILIKTPFAVLSCRGAY